MATARDIPVRTQHVVARRLGDEMVLLNPETEAYFTLNEVGAHIWELIDGQRTVTQIIEALLLEYDVPESELRADVDELLDDLVGQQLLKAAHERA